MHKSAYFFEELRIPGDKRNLHFILYHSDQFYQELLKVKLLLAWRQFQPNKSTSGRLEGESRGSTNLLMIFLSSSFCASSSVLCDCVSFMIPASASQPLKQFQKVFGDASSWSLRTTSSDPLILVVAVDFCCC